MSLQVITFRCYRTKFGLSSDKSVQVVTIQANLVLGLCELLTMATSKAWLHIGLAIRMAQTLRMRRENNRCLVPRGKSGDALSGHA